MKLAPSVLCLMAVVLSTPAAWAQLITFVDSTARGPNLPATPDGNTSLNGADFDFTATVGNATTTTNSADDKWRYRADDGTGVNDGVRWGGGHGWEADARANLDEATSPLMITLNLSPNSTYNLYGFFYDQSDTTFTGATLVSFYDAAFSVDTTGSGPGVYTNYTPQNSTLPTADEFSNPGDLVLATLLTGTNAALGPWSLNKASLGAFTTDATGVINIYVQSPMVDYTDADIKPTGWDPTNISTSVGPNANQRTEFDGVGYQLVQPSSLPGDFDGDGDVDGADFIAWQTHFPTANGATTSQGDADGDGDVDGADFAAWQASFPVAPSSGAVSVPEPTSCALAVIACLGAWRFRRQRPRTGRCRGLPLGNR